MYGNVSLDNRKQTQPSSYSGAICHDLRLGETLKYSERDVGNCAQF